MTRILTNGTIWTGRRHVEAIATDRGRVVAAGTRANVLDAAPRDAAEIDLGGRRAIPGLIDSHVHFLRAGLNWEELVRWDDGVESLSEGLARITEAAAAAPDGTWLRVLGGWHPGQFSERRSPTRAELDAAAPRHPVYVQLLYEEALLNREAIARALGREDPPGGWIERDADGRPTGLIRGPGAFQAVLGGIPLGNRASQRSSTRAVMREFNAAGLTTVVDPGGFGVTPESYRALFDTWRANEMTLRCRLYLVPATRGNEVEEAREWVRYIQPGFGDDLLRYAGMGEILTFGCHDLEGLSDFSVTPEATRDLEEIVRTLAGAGWNVHMHSVLDATTSAILDVWETVDREIGLGGRYSLGHVEPVSHRNLDRIAALGAGIGIQNRMMFRAADSDAAWGGGVIEDAPPLREILERGIPMGAGTDGTVVSPFDPWRSIWWLVTGKSVDGAPPRRERHRLTVEEALTAYTSGSAWIAIEEDRLGGLEPGMLADVAVLDRDPFVIDPDELPDVTVDLTLIGGEPVHISSAFGGLT